MKTSAGSLALLTTLVALLAVGCASPSSSPSTSPSTSATTETPETIVGAADRTDADRALDAGRQPVELLRFLDLKPGMKVADLGAGGGYTTELLSRAVGASGTVLGQNSTWLLERFAQKPWAERLARPQNKNVVRVEREFDDPIPAEHNGTVDVVVNVLFYHDTVWLKTDRALMNKNIFSALKPGGRYVIVDHSARAGDGLTAVQTLHRIEEQLVRDEIVAAGFVVDAEGAFLKNPEDTRDWNANPSGSGDKRGTSDRFVIAFKKPAP